VTLHQHQPQRGDSRSFDLSHPKLKSAGFNDKESSVYNRTAYAWLVHEHTGHGGDFFCIRPGESVDDLHLNTLRVRRQFVRVGADSRRSAARFRARRAS
jgi:hypothetical protein